jgi:hypothetical protein
MTGSIRIGTSTDIRTHTMPRGSSGVSCESHEVCFPMCDIFALTYMLYYKWRFDAGASARGRLDTYLTTYGLLGFFSLGNDERDDERSS